MPKLIEKTVLLLCILLLLASCRTKNKENPTADALALNLKKGEPILCGPPGKQFGSVAFDISCTDKTKPDFNLAVALLHSFEYDEAEKVFAKIIESEPSCAMAYWGIAMCNYHPLWAPAITAELQKGSRAIEIARTLGHSSERESGYIEAIAMYYKDWDKADDHSRCIRFEKAMEMMYKKYPNDHEAAIFYALALDAAADPTDKSFANQKKAGNILNVLYTNEPAHPGIIHYIIHTYDYPGLAQLALPAARKYASVAPSSAHAQHMPSHIFTRLGLWDESIQSNLASTASAKCYAENAGIRGHWDEELHGMDYLVYAYLQKADTAGAKGIWDSLKTITEVYPVDFKDAYAYAAIPARYALENRHWNEAAHLQLQPSAFPWEKFPWQAAINHFARLLGSVHTGDTNAALDELKTLKAIHDRLLEEKDVYKARQVEIQMKSGEAWIDFKLGRKNDALTLMEMAANMEDGIQKHPVTPGEVIPARELLGDMLLQMNNPVAALEAYLTDLQIHPNRFNGLYGAAMAAEKTGDKAKTATYYQQLSDISVTNSTRPELTAARLFLKNHSLPSK